MREGFETFLVALTYYTRIPIAHSFQNLQTLQARSILYFPVMGWIVGGMGALVFQGALVFFPKSVALLLSMAGTILLTGALHEDGFADSCDGFGGGFGKEAILTIMKDPRIGSYGILGLTLLLGLKYASLLALETSWLPWVLVVSHSLSRATAASLLFDLDYVGASAQSKSKSLVKRLSLRELGFLIFWGMLPCLIFLPKAYSLLLLVLVVLQMGLKRYFQRRLGGYTGDCLGAVQQISEVVIYLLILASLA